MRGIMWKALIPPAVVPLALWLMVAMAGPGGPLDVSRDDADPAVPAASVARLDEGGETASGADTSGSFREGGAVTAATDAGDGGVATAATDAVDDGVVTAVTDAVDGGDEPAPAPAPSAVPPSFEEADVAVPPPPDSSSPDSSSDPPEPSEEAPDPTPVLEPDRSATVTPRGYSKCDGSDEFLMEKDQNGGVEIRGGIVSFFDGSKAVIESPDGPLAVVVTKSTKVDGELNGATEVWVKGVLQKDGSILADEVKVWCLLPARYDGMSLRRS